MNLKEWCIENNKEEYLNQWDKKLNLGISPETISYGSTKKVHWICEKGHTWILSVNNRTSKGGSKCPICLGKRAWKGFNDLETRYPNIASEWDYEKNDMKPCDYLGASNKKVGWICPKGHHYEAKINDRTKKNGTGCPFCSGQKILVGYNDLQSKYPEITAEWDVDRNEKSVYEVSAHSGYQAWWLCKKGHSYTARICDRTKKNGTGCPYCAGKKLLVGFNDLDFLYPEIASEWNYEKNNPITPKMVTTGMKKKFWWKCLKGHSWQATLSSRCNCGTGCPYCAGERVIEGENDLETKNPELAKEWDYEKNGLLTPKNIMVSSGKKVWWMCKKGHSWLASPNNRIGSGKITGCPTCNLENHSSFPEQAIMFYFKKFFNCKNRYKIDNVELDVYIPEISMAIEYDGIYYHSSDSAKKRDSRKNFFCINHGIDLYRVKETKDYKKVNKQNILFRKVPEDGKLLDEIIYELLAIAEKKSNKNLNKNINVNRDREEIWSTYINLEKENSIEKRYPHLAIEWDAERNGGITPDLISIGSHKKMHWICSSGHRYIATAKARVGGTGCPYCAGKKVLMGYNDLQSKCPEIASEWAYDYNKELKPTMFTEHSGKKVFWRCQEGHIYEAVIAKRTSGRGCPVCFSMRRSKGLRRKRL